jgi:hypothetical protein
MNLRNLRYFVGVAETGSVSLTAELPIDHRVEAAHSTLVLGVTSRSNFPAMYR